MAAPNSPEEVMYPHARRLALAALLLAPDLAGAQETPCFAPLPLDPWMLEALRAHPFGRLAALIGTVSDDARNFVQANTSLGGRRMIDWLTGEPLPRIC